RWCRDARPRGSRAPRAVDDGGSARRTMAVSPQAYVGSPSRASVTIADWGNSRTGSCSSTLRCGPASSTLGNVRRLLVVILCVACAALPGVASAQVVVPLHAGGPAQKAMDQLPPPTPLEQVREQALRQSPPLPPPPQIIERWVPERYIFAPELGKVVLIPGHYE